VDAGASSLACDFVIKWTRELRRRSQLDIEMQFRELIATSFGVAARVAYYLQLLQLSTGAFRGITDAALVDKWSPRRCR